MHKHFFIATLLISATHAESQVHGGLEQYYYAGAKQSAVVPKIYYETDKHWYGEVHYNYEAFETVSCNIGKSFENKKNKSTSVTPFAGIVLGSLNGCNLGSNVNIEHRKIFFSSELQYTFSFQQKTSNFFYTWCEGGYYINDFLYTGLALQVTHLFEQKNYWQPGVMLGLYYKKIAIPIYAFTHNRFSSSFVIGVEWEWEKANDKSKDLQNDYYTTRNNNN